MTEAELSQWQAGYESVLKLYEAEKPYNEGSLPSLSIGPLVALWKFDFMQGDNVVDSSGNRLDGRLVGSACVVADPERGNVLSLDGKNAYVDIGNDPVFNITDEITVAFWMKAERQQSYQATMLSKGDRTWRMAMFHNEYYLEFGRNYGSSTRYIAGQTDVKDGQWHHIAAVYDGSSMYLYVDGRLDVSNTLTRKTGTSDAPVWIGGNCDYDLDRCFHGLLDDVRVYRYALSEAEVSAIHAGERPSR